MLSDLPNASLVVERIARADAEATALARARAQQKQELDREEADALADRARLAEAGPTGLFTEHRGVDDRGNATIERKPDTRRLKAADARVNAIKRQKVASLASTAPIPRLTATRIESELAKCTGQSLREVSRPALALNKNERPIDALPRFRQASLDLLGERREVEKAPRSFGEVEAAAHREIDKLADRGLPRTISMFHGGKIKWPRDEVRSGTDTLALVAFLMRDKLKAEISKLIKINAGAFPNAMTANERNECLAELDAEIEVAERIEAACVEVAVAEGGKAHHRPDISVLAVLSLSAAG